MLSSTRKMSRECFFISCVLLLVNIALGFQNGHMRLVGGQSSNEGRVEVYYNGHWGTVCDDGWDMAEAKVVCRYLNFADAKAAVAGGREYGPGSGNIWMDDLTCTGTEDGLTGCGFRGWGVSDCKHEEDAGVICMQEADVQNVSREYEVEHSTEISELLGALFDSGRDCDFNITVEEDNSTLETVCVHKLILTLDPKASFLNVSLTNLSSLSIDVSSNCHQYVTTFVRYLYTREIGITTSSAQCIHKMASDWGLKQLQDEARKLFIYLLPQDSTFQTQISLYGYSVHTGDKVMQKICLRYLAWNFEALVRSPTWTSVPLGTIKVLLSRSDLVVPSESYILQGLESWEAAHVSAPITEDQFDLLKLIRFPMISAEDLFRLQNPRYQAGKFLGFQFSALRIGQLFGELLRQWKPYTPRIYTDKPWSFAFDDQEVHHYIKTGYFYRNNNHYGSLSASFSTPVHTSAYFTLFRDMSWSTQLYITSDECSNNGFKCPAAMLSPERNNDDLPAEFQKSIVYENKVVLSCAGKYVFHVQDFKRVSNSDMALIPATTVHPCDSNQHKYQVVVRPKYTTGLKFTEEEEE